MALSHNGIAKLKQNTAALLQIIEVDSFQLKKSESARSIPRVALSDGFAYAKWYLLPDDVIKKCDCTKDEILYQLITVKKTEVKNTFNIITVATIEKRGLKGPIGQPITYEEFIANDGNPKGSNIIPGMTNTDVTPGGNSQKSGTAVVHEEFKASDSNTGSNALSRQNTSKPEKKPVATKQTTLPLVQPSTIKQEQPKPVTKPQPQKRSVSNPPIQKVEPKKREAIQNDNMFTPLTDLFAGQEGWTIKVRLILKTDLRKIKTKKGDDTYVLNLEFIDRQGTVMGASCFGDTAEKFANALQLDYVYEVSNALVTQDVKAKGQIPFKITLGQKAIVNEADDDATIPSLKDRTTSLAEYINKPLGSDCNLICLVKSAGQPQRFVSKAGKNCVKRPVLICDPQDKVELNITLWGQAVNINFENCPYYISNMVVSEYQGSKQYSSGFSCMIVPLKDHKWRRFKDVTKIECKKANQPSGGRKGTRSTIIDMLDKTAFIEPKGKVWSEMKCFVNTIRTTGSMWYLGCPNDECKKKVVLETKSQCPSCNKHYDNAKYRWILSVQFVDFTGSVWASVYNQQGETIVGRTADQLHTLDVEAIKQIMKESRNTEYVVLFRSVEEKHQEQSRIKHNVTKLLPVNPVDEANICIKQINQYLNL